MNEKVLDTLMKLFAIIAREEDVTTEEVRVIEDFLYQQLTDEVASAYLARFTAYASTESQETVAELCTSVNNDLTAKQKLYILIRLLELISADKFISSGEVTAFDTVVEKLNIDAADYEPIYNFVTTDKPRQLLNRNLLIISSGLGSLRGAQLAVEHFVGYIAILHIESVDLYALRYIGNGEAQLNGQLLRPDIVYILTPGSVIRSPRVSPIFFSDIVGQFLAPQQKDRITFEAKNISYIFQNGRIALHPLSIYEQGSGLVALMGGSGAGKSTLLNVLNGNYVPATGEVLINGLDLNQPKEAKSLRGLIGYISQDDLLIEELTVQENLYFNAQLCFGGYTEPRLQALVRQMLEDLGLLEIRHLKVGSILNKKISGGQRKRLNIALELIREPSVLFVDEPTSGLSSRDSENVMDLLKELSLKGKLVFVVIHQPSSDIFKMFDRLFILDVGGYPIYYGNPLEGVRYFRRTLGYAQSELAECDECGNVNPEQIFNIIETRVVDEYGHLTAARKLSPERWHELFQIYLRENPPITRKREPAKPTENTETPLEPVRRLNPPNRMRQLGIFLIRDLTAKFSNRAYLLVNLLEAPLLAFLLAYIFRYYDKDVSNKAGYTLFGNVNLPAYILTCILVALFIGLTVSAEEILRDRRMRKREAFLHLSRHSYLLAKVVLLFTLSALQALLFVWIGNSITGINGLTGSYWLMLFSLMCFANLVGLNVSASFDNAVTIYVLVPLLLIPQIVLSGALVSFSKLNPSLSRPESVPIAGDIMASRWAFEALAVTQFKDNAYEHNFYADDKVISQAGYKLNNWLPRLQSKLDYCFNHYKTQMDLNGVREQLATLDIELHKELAGFANPNSFEVLDALKNGRFNEKIGKQIQRILNALAHQYQLALAQATDRRDSTLQALEKNHYSVQVLRQANENERLTDLVTNKAESSSMAEIENHLVQLADPVFLDPTGGHTGLRAHFFAPQKYVGRMVVHTFWYNLCLIWVMTLLLYFTLYTEFLRQVLQGIGTLYDRFQVMLENRNNQARALILKKN